MRGESLPISPENKTPSLDDGRFNYSNEPFEIVTEQDEEKDEEKWKEIPTLAWCAYCKGEIRTQVNYVNSSKTFWSSVGIFLMGGVVGCFLLPYFTDKCKNPQLVCSRCQHKLSN